MNKNARISICGATRVGKTSIFRRLTGKELETTYYTTHGIDCDFKTLTSIPYVITLYDLSGNPAHYDITTPYIIKSDMLLMVYDTYDASSILALRELYKKYTKDLNWTGDIIVVGNKKDENTDATLSKVNTSQGEYKLITMNNTYFENVIQGENFAHDIQSSHITVSARTGEDIKSLWSTITQTLEPSHSTFSLYSSKPVHKRFKCCVIL